MKTKPTPNPNKPPSSEAGYTIIEGIIAILVVTILMVAVTPMVVFSAATRMQAKRVQLASQAARSYLTVVKANPSDQAPGNIQDQNATTFGPPDKNDLKDGQEGERCVDPGDNDVITDQYCSGKKLYCVSFDEEPGCQTDSPVDLVVQPIVISPYIEERDASGNPIRDDSGNPIPDAEKGYGLAIRVYRASAFGSNTDNLSIGEVGQSEDRVLSFLGRSDLPLIQTTTAIPPSGSGNQYNTLCELLDGCGND